MVGSESFETMLQQLEKTVVVLYKALLLYQMKSVCSYYRNQGLVFFRNLANLDDWDSYLKSVTDAEATLEKNLGQYNVQYGTSSLGRLVKLGEITETLLGDLRQDLRAFIDHQKTVHTADKDKEL